MSWGGAECSRIVGQCAHLIKLHKVIIVPSGKKWELQQMLIKAHLGRNHTAAFSLYEHSQRTEQLMRGQPNWASLKYSTAYKTLFYSK